MENQGWLWVTASLSVYFLDILLRLFHRNFVQYDITNVNKLPGNVCQITFISSAPKHNLITKPGQYILLQCSKISSLEWHPFTITSVDSDSSQTSFNVLMRMRGDWTKMVCRMINFKKENSILPSTHVPIRLLVDGPFCSPLESSIHCRVAVCIAGGIGITPFMALLNFLGKNNTSHLSRPHRIHLVWVVQRCSHLKWAKHLISNVHVKFWSQNQPDRLQVSLFVTKDYSLEAVQEILVDDCKFLLRRVSAGRPCWHEIFSEWANIYNKKEVNIFLCGPESLTKQVKQECDKYNQRGCSFRCVIETFS
uniref:FAD-binding FR-type domain-containing protein n=2 Tax=Clastoptera arizonana TaxID=38151 RepID=A0A1B6CGZ7_9HEMI